LLTQKKRNCNQLKKIKICCNISVFIFGVATSQGLCCEFQLLELSVFRQSFYKGLFALMIAFRRSLSLGESIGLHCNRTHTKSQNDNRKNRFRIASRHKNNINSRTNHRSTEFVSFRLALIKSTPKKNGPFRQNKGPGRLREKAGAAKTTEAVWIHIPIKLDR
jgi:hypothetical protein